MHNVTRRIILAVMMILVSGAISSAETTMEEAAFPSLATSIRITGPLDFCGEAVPLDNPDVRERLEKDLMLSLWSRPQVLLWIKRANRYFPHIERVLAENNMPDDLKYVAIAESALRPHAGSPKGAVGFWQFIKATGKNYGLVINKNIDERRNVFYSTRAAVKYFMALYEDFGSWTLSAAAYNMGERGLRKEMLAQQVKDYYKLHLYLETQRYIFRILSAKLILSDPEKYGFQLTPEDLYAPLQFDRVKINNSKEIPIQVVAEAADTYFKMIKDLNPEIRGHHIPKGGRIIFIPKGASERFYREYKQLTQTWQQQQAKTDKNIYVVKKGDSLTAIAERFGVPLKTLLIWNRLGHKKPIYPGQRLVIQAEKEKSKTKTE